MRSAASWNGSDSTFSFELLLDQTGRCIEPLYNLRAQYFQSGGKPVDAVALRHARQQFDKAPVEVSCSKLLLPNNNREVSWGYSVH